MQTAFTKIRNGKYSADRVDGRKFVILRALDGKRWIIEAQDTLDVDDAPTLSCAKRSISNGWTPITRIAG